MKTSKEEMLKVIYEKIADKTLSLGCMLIAKEQKMWIDGSLLLYKYVRSGSSSSEWYDWRKIQPWEMVFSDFRTWEFKFINLNSRSSMYREPNFDEDESVDDDFVAKHFEIIWHPVMIGDVLDWIHINDKWYLPEWFDRSSITKLLRIYNKTRKPIDDQDDECIEFIYNLCKDA